MTKDKQFGVDIEKVCGSEASVYAREIWNAAIEAAAKVIDQANRDGPYNALVAAPEIRKLKK